MNGLSSVKVAFVKFLLQSRTYHGDEIMRPDGSTQFVVITGASTGIGAACAIECARRGVTVFAGVRTHEAGEALRKSDGALVVPIQLDVTDAESIRQAAGIVRQAIGEKGLAGLVNNAGIAISGPLEYIPLDRLRKQFEVNVIGQIAVTQAFLPMLRQARGRIVNMGSIAGRAATPMIGPYSASKFALEALTDALRMEVRHFGVRVAIVEPGAIATPIWDKSAQMAAEMEAAASAEAKTLYGETIHRVREAFDQAARRAISTDAVVAAVWHALTADRPKTRYLVGTDARIRAMMVKWLPDRLQDWILKKVLKLPKA